MMTKILLILLIIISPCYAQSTETTSEIAEQEEADSRDRILLKQSLRYTERRLNDIENQTQDRVLLWFIPNELATGTNKSGRLDLPFSGTITKATAYSKTAPTGADLIFDINLNGTSIWATTQANRVEVAASANTGSQTAFDTTAVSVDDYFTIDVDQIGSGTAGENATVQLIIEVDIND